MPHNIIIKGQSDSGRGVNMTPGVFKISLFFAVSGVNLTPSIDLLAFYAVSI